jgi:hypothetical protein
VCISDASRVLDPWHPPVHLALAGFEKNGSARIFCGGIPSNDCRTIRNSTNARPSCCASREKRIWRGMWKRGRNK